MTTFQTYYYILATIGGLSLIIKYGYAFVKRVDDTHRLVKHIYENDIYHMAHALRRICDRLNIDYEDIPPFSINGDK